MTCCPMHVRQASAYATGIDGCDHGREPHIPCTVCPAPSVSRMLISHVGRIITKASIGSRITDPRMRYSIVQP